jgi:hypothetical protein
MKAIFLRVIDADDKGTALLEAIQQRDASLNEVRYDVDPATFARIPRSPFAYWVSDRVRAAFTRLPGFESDGRTAKQGLATADDFRFVRLWTEAPPVAVDTRWFSFAKGGRFSPFYANMHVLVNWQGGGAEIKNNLNDRGGVRSNVWMLRDTALNCFFRPGLTWPARPHRRGAFAVVPRGVIFSHTGTMVFESSTDGLLATCALLNSNAYIGLLHLLMPRGTHGGGQTLKYEVGYVTSVPVPRLAAGERAALTQFSRHAWSLMRSLQTRTETSHAFVLPALLQVEGASLAERTAAWVSRVASVESEVADIQRKVDEQCFALYGIDGSDRQKIECGLGGADQGLDDTGDNDEEDDDGELQEIHAAPLVASLVSWLVGTAFGRFDLRLATGKREAPCEPQPFDPLPVCSAGMLTGDDGLASANPPSGYPIAFPGEAILVDDPGFNGGQPHRDDIVRRIREVLDLLWKDQAHKMEQEACEILGVKEPRDYFRRPSGFFQDHLKRYSKSRRKAPIYWPLSTASGSYTIWLYYHRLTDQTLYAAVNKYVEPKLTEVEHAAAHVEKELETASGREATRLRDRLNEARAFAGELRDLRQELLRIAALPYRPNLNDGVIINAAPFHKLFRLRPWAKETEQVWTKLERGEYDWAHLAYTIWPERAKETCRKDRSIAIAHGREDLCDVEPPASKGRGKGKGRKKKEVKG